MENSPVPAPAQPELKELQVRCDQLQQLVSSLLLILIVISGTLSVFLWRQYRLAKADVAATQSAVAPLLMEYTNNRVGVEDFIRKLAEYGRTHPDFAPIFTRYHLGDYQAKPGAASVTSSLPPSAVSNK